MNLAAATPLNWLRSDAQRRLFGAVLLFVLLLRTLIPAGYMPDLPKLQHGIFDVTICTAQGTQTVQVDGQGQPVQAKHARADICAFAWSAPVAHAAAVFAALVAPFVTASPDALTPAVIGPSRQYGPQQPRAPPAV